MQHEPIPVIVLENISKRFGALPILKNINLTVYEREKIVILGPSGSGKSTLIRCMNRLEIPDSGSIRVRGVDIAQQKDFQKVRHEMGMVFQQFNLFPHMSILDNCTLALRMVKKMPRQEAEARACHYLEKVHIQDQAHKWPRQLSGGQQQRAAIARALCLESSIMLLDEITASLDPEMVKEVFDVVMQLALEGMTIVCVTHAMGFAEQFADRVVFMDQGEIVEEASPSVFFRTPQNPRSIAFLQKVKY